jgi:hypothetical protein
MTTRRNPDPIVSAWLEEGPNRLPDVTRRAIAVDVRTTNQSRRGLIAPWRVLTVNGMSRLVLGTIAVVVALGGLYLFGNRGPGPSSGVGGEPSPTLAPSEPSSPPPSAKPSAVAGLELTETFVSSQHGYAVAHPAGVTPQPGPSTDKPDFIRATQPDFGVFRASSVEAPDGVSIDEWIDEFLTGAGSACNPPRSTLQEISVDGQAGRVRYGCPGEVEATVVVGRRVYLFTLFSDAPDAKAVFDAFAATIDLRPEDAVETPSPTPS